MTFNNKCNSLSLAYKIKNLIVPETTEHLANRKEAVTMANDLEVRLQNLIDDNNALLEHNYKMKQALALVLTVSQDGLKESS